VEQNSASIVIGTSAELIKIAPLIRRLEKANYQYKVLYTSQHVGGLDALLLSLQIYEARPRFVILRRSADLTSSFQTFKWIFDVALFLFRNLKGKTLVIVHGDTMTTLMGSLLGKFKFCTIAHIEAGVRSGSIFHPLPEEFIRRLVGKLAQIHFPPSPRESINLSERKVILPTTHNTGLDNILDIFEEEIKSNKIWENRNLVLVSLHRTEFLANRQVFRDTIIALNKLVDYCKIIVVMDQRFKKALEVHNAQLDNRITNLSKLPYAEFMSMLLYSKAVITDSGGLQQEMIFLRIPGVIHRVSCEEEIIPEIHLLSRWDCQSLIAFILNRGLVGSRCVPQVDPATDYIIDEIRKRNLIEK
jgi:UDP-N-acetylglucosamine 2-epimerase (non-hydrolysing)